MSSILVTGFERYSLLTQVRGNPSEVAATALGDMFGPAAAVKILPVSANCIPLLRAELASEPRGVLMLGANLQLANCVLELEGVETATKRRLRSTFAAALSQRSQALGFSVSSAPPAPFVYWCLRSYYAALEWAEPRGVPCAFVHLNVAGNFAAQLDPIAKVFRSIQSRVGVRT